MIKFIYFLLKLFITLLLIPANIAGIEWIIKNLRYTNPKTNTSFLYFLVGIFVYILFHYFVLRATWFHVLAHELTHAFFSLLFGGKVSKIKVSSKGGYVESNKTNLLVTLSPYIFPFYLIMFIIIWIIAKHFYGIAIQKYNNYIISLFGFFLGFHIIFTLESILVDQPDLRVFGIIFSLMLIIFVNTLILAIILKIFFPRAISLEDLYTYILHKERTFWITVYVITKKYIPIVIHNIPKLWTKTV